MKSHILADQSDIGKVGSCLDALYHGSPLCKVGIRGVNTKFAANHRGKSGFFKHQGCFVKVGKCDIFNNTVRLYVTEQRNLLENRLLQRLVTAKHNYVRVNSHSLQLFHRMLGGLGLMFVRAAQKRN